MTDEEYIERANQDYEATAGVIIQSIGGPDSPPAEQVVTRTGKGAWVMAWVWVEDNDLLVE